MPELQNNPQNIQEIISVYKNYGILNEISHFSTDYKSALLQILAM